MTDRRPPRRPDAAPSAVRSTGGCLVALVCIWFELTIGIVITAMIAEAVAPALAARGYNVRTGAGFLIAALLGLIVALYPMIWLHRAGRALRRRLGLRD